MIHIQIPGSLGSACGIFGQVIIAAVQSQQRKDGSIDTLEHRLLKISQRLQKIESTHIGGISANGCPCQDHTGILGVLLGMEDTCFLGGVGCNPLAVTQQVFLHALQFRPGKPQSDPFTCHRAETRFRYFGLQILGGFQKIVFSGLLHFSLGGFRLFRGFLAAAAGKSQQHCQHKQN